MRWMLWFVVAGVAGGLAGCGEGRPAGAGGLDRAPELDVSAEATLAMAREQTSAAASAEQWSAELLPPRPATAYAPLTYRLTFRADPWWHVDEAVRTGGGSGLLPSIAISDALAPAFRATGSPPGDGARIDGAGGVLASAGRRGWRVGVEQELWWHRSPEVWATRAGVVESERGRAAGAIQLTRPLGETLEASFGYHRSLGQPLDREVGMEPDEQSLFLRFGWEF